jgi:hypothetical protein
VSTCAAHDPPGNAIVSGRTPSIGFPALTAAAEELVPLVEKDAAEAERLSRQTDRVVASRGRRAQPRRRAASMWPRQRSGCANASLAMPFLRRAAP